MPITNQQRIYIAVLGLAAAAWGVDRFFLHGGVTAPAGAQAASLLITRGAALSPASPLADQPAPAISLAERLDHFSAQAQQAAPARDVFAPPISWMPTEKPAAPTVAVADSLQQTLSDFRQSHTLTAVIRAGRNSQIFMGSRIVRLGESMDGFKLIGVTESSATFDFRNTPVTLQLSDPGAPSPASGSFRNAK